jgi:hypothetical protein
MVRLARLQECRCSRASSYARNSSWNNTPKLWTRCSVFIGAILGLLAVYAAPAGISTQAGMCMQPNLSGRVYLAWKTSVRPLAKSSRSCMQLLSPYPTDEEISKVIYAQRQIIYSESNSYKLLIELISCPFISRQFECAKRRSNPAYYLDKGASSVRKTIRNSDRPVRSLAPWKCSIIVGQVPGMIRYQVYLDCRR